MTVAARSGCRPNPLGETPNPLFFGSKTGAGSGGPPSCQGAGRVPRAQRILVYLLPIMLMTTAAAHSEPCGGELVSVASGATVPLATTLTTVVGTTGMVLLGERHGVREHPKAAACLIAALAIKTRPTVVMEMLSADQRPALETYRSAHPEIVDGLGTTLAWWKTGWPAWSIYTPLFDAVWHTRSRLATGDLAAKAILKTPAELDAIYGTALTSVRKSWGEAMATAHCGLIDQTKTAILADRQINRDLAMADAVRNAAKDAPVLLYAGRAHARQDRSVGYLLRASDKPVVAISLQEVSVAGVAVDRKAVLADAKGRYDYVWFTGVADKADSCERLRAKGLIATAGAK